MFSEDSQNADTTEFSFAKAIILNNRTAEVVIYEGVEVNSDMLDQLRLLWASYLDAPFSLLINKVNHYTYSFSAQEKLFDIEGLDAIAIVSYSRITKLTTESLLKSFHHSDRRDIKIFSDRNQALCWLLTRQDYLKLFQSVNHLDSWLDIQQCKEQVKSKKQIESRRQIETEADRT